MRNSASALVASGAFTPTQSLAFAGIELRIDGVAGRGRHLHGSAGAQRDVFATLDRLVTAIDAPPAASAQRAQTA